MAGANSKGMRKRGRGPSRVSPETTGTAPTADQDTNGHGTGSDRTTTTTATAGMWDRIREQFQPLLGITVVVLVPYGLYLAYRFVCLQRPAWWARVALNGTIVRPSFAEHEARPVLIVGTMSAGTTQLAHELRTTLGLEIGHKNSETTWNFVRDGTVSWFHGIRFLPRPGLDDDQPMVSTKNRYNQGQLSLDWDDLLGGRHGSHKKDGDRDLQQRLQQLTQELDYPNNG